MYNVTDKDIAAFRQIKDMAYIKISQAVNDVVAHHVATMAQSLNLVMAGSIGALYQSLIYSLHLCEVMAGRAAPADPATIDSSVKIQMAVFEKVLNMMASSLENLDPMAEYSILIVKKEKPLKTPSHGDTRKRRKK